MATVFSKILAGEAPASFVYRDDLVAAVMDIQKA
jgi:diadenosine tetraphosphate (Ap4A) HIT family hydrolase